MEEGADNSLIDRDQRVVGIGCMIKYIFPRALALVRKQKTEQYSNML